MKNKKLFIYILLFLATIYRINKPIDRSDLAILDKQWFAILHDFLKIPEEMAAKISPGITMIAIIG